MQPQSGGESASGLPFYPKYSQPCEFPVPDGVLRRRKHHVAGIQWLARWSVPLQCFFAAVSFFTVLLPVLSRSWHAVVLDIPLLNWLSDQFSTYGPASWVWLVMLMLLALAAELTTKHYPGGWNPVKEEGFPSALQSLQLQLYPRSTTEEWVFWLHMARGTLGTTLWLFAPFSLLAYFARL